MDQATHKVRILIADDHPLFLKGLQELIEEESDWQVVSKAEDGKQALDSIIEKSPTIAILDINMPHHDGLEIAKYVFEHNLPTDVIILTMYDDELIINKAVSYDVKGFILKENAIDDILEGVETVSRGDYFISPKLANRKFTGHSDIQMLQDALRIKLTKTEQKVIKLVSEDFTTKKIAEKLFISPKTVENHRSNICKKLKLTGKNALLRYVLGHKDTLRRILQDC